MAAAKTVTAKTMSAAPGARLAEVADELARHAAAVRSRDAVQRSNEEESARLQKELAEAQAAFDAWNAPAARLARAKRAAFDYSMSIAHNENVGEGHVRNAMPTRIRKALEVVAAELNKVRLAPEPPFPSPGERGKWWEEMQARTKQLQAARAKLIAMSNREWSDDATLREAVREILVPLFEDILM